MTDRRWLAWKCGGLLILVLAACADSRPSELDAHRQLQSLLDATSPGAWRVEQVECMTGRKTRYDGGAAYVMELRVRVRVQRAVVNNGVLSGLNVLYQSATGKPWLLQIVGGAGAERDVVLKTRWLQTDEGWRLLGTCNDCL